MTNYYLSSRAYEDITPWGGQQNMLLQSNSFTTTWTATNATATQGTDADPSGGTAAWRLIDNSTNAGHGVSQSITKAASALRYTLSINVKAGPTLGRIAVVIGDSASVAPTNGVRWSFDLVNGQIGSINAIGAGFTNQFYRIEPVYNRAGWYRITVSVISGTGTTLGVAIQTDNGTATAATSVSYVGSSNYMLIYGAQLEPTLYIAGAYTATTTTAATQTVSFSATVGMIRRPTDPGRDGFGVTAGIGIGSESAYRCTTAGTTGSVEPSAANGNPWPMKASSTVTDNAAVWTEITGQESFQTAGSWAPFARIDFKFQLNYLQVNTISSFPAGGSGYAVGDILLITGVTTPINYPVVKVSSVTTGAITGVTILNQGIYLAGTSALSTTKVTGSGNNAATITLTTSAFGSIVAGDTICIGNTHCQNQTTALSMTMQGTIASPNILISVDSSASGHIPPTSADYLPGARFQLPTLQSHQILSAVEFYGITFQVGSTAGSSNWQGMGSVTQKYKDCAFWVSGTASGGLQQASPGYLIWDNVTFQTSATTNTINFQDNFEWRNTAAAIKGSISPSTLITSGGAGSSTILKIEGVDLSSLGSNKIVSAGNSGPVQIVRCKLGPSAVVTTPGPGLYSTQVDVIQCDSGSALYRNERYWTQATLITDIAVVRTGGAADGATPISWKVSTTANNGIGWPFETIRSSIYNSTTGSTVNVSIFGVCNIAAPLTSDLWLDVDYFGTASSALGAISSQQIATRLSSGSALTADTSAWDTSVTARANTTAYSVGNVIKVASNTGRIFICTTPGTSAGSEPGGYASAVDGGSVTDNTAVFRAGYRFKQTIAVTPQSAGLIHAIAKVATSSTTGLFWIDPHIVLS